MSQYELAVAVVSYLKKAGLNKINEDNAVIYAALFDLHMLQYRHYTIFSAILNKSAWKNIKLSFSDEYYDSLSDVVEVELNLFISRVNGIVNIEDEIPVDHQGKIDYEGYGKTVGLTDETVKQMICLQNYFDHWDKVWSGLNG